MADALPPPPLPQGAGYGVLVGMGLAFAIGMIYVTRGMKRSFNENNASTETFMVADRSVGTGLTAAAVISSWLYSTALLGATLLTYRYGLALGVWWGASASIVVCFLACISIEAKRRAPKAHTLLELIRVRYGTATHVIWIVFCLLNNTLVFSSMLLGASTAVTSLTGMNTVAAIYLMPLGVAIYTYFGGLRATFLTDYVHTFIIMIILVWFTIQVMVSKEVGSIGHLYDVIVAADLEKPVEGNYQGSHLTMRSDQCLYFGILHVISNFGGVILDTGFWQKGFSADVAAAVPGYILGGVASFSVPWTIGTVAGLAAIAVERTPAWPIYPRAMTDLEINSGFVLPYLAQAVAGRAGAATLLVVIFMACTSIASAQMIATSSIISFDIYGTYINKNPTNAQLIRWSHIGVIVSALFISTLATAFHYGGVNMTFLLYALGNWVNPGVFPTIFALLWKKQTRAAIITSTLTGSACGLSTWMGTAYYYAGAVNVDSLALTLPNLFGSVTAFLVPLPITVAISYMWPHDFEWSSFGQIQTIKSEVGRTQPVEREDWLTPEKQQYMKKMSRWAAFWFTFTVLGHAVLWPLAMYGAQMVFTKPFFTAWMIIAFIYLWFTLVVGSIYPLVDGGAKKIWTVLRGATGKDDQTEKQTSQEVTSGSSSEHNIDPKTGTLGVKVTPA